jgi:hypothetical protein
MSKIIKELFQNRAFGCFDKTSLEKIMKLQAEEKSF